MTSERAAAAYLQPAIDATWRWDESGDFIERLDGTRTIAHRLMIWNLLSDINASGMGGLPDLHTLVAYLEELALEPMVEHLDLTIPLRNIPRRVDYETGEDIINHLRVPFRNTGLRELPVAESQELSEALAELRAKSTEELEHLAATGLSAAPQPSPEPIFLADRVKTVLSHILNDDEDEMLTGVVKLTRDLLGLVRLPGSTDEPVDLPLGGVSDIINKGKLSHLLVSELAQDDDLLMSRLAMREALYLRRESPPVPRSETCHVLLDSTVRMWGIPRVFALSVGLAVLLRSGTRTNAAGREILLFHTDDDDVAQIDSATREGLKAHLEHLDNAHLPVGGLDSLMERPFGTTRPVASETLLVTAEEVFEDPDFQAAINVPPGHTLYVATVRIGGRFRLWRIGRRNHRLLQQGQLDLSDIAPGQGLGNQQADQLPDFFRLSPPPVRVPHPEWNASLKNLCFCERRGLLGISRRGEVLHQPVDVPGIRKLPQWLHFAPVGKTIGPFWIGEDFASAALIFKSENNLRSDSYSQTHGEFLQVDQQLGVVHRTGIVPRHSAVKMYGSTWLLFNEDARMVHLYSLCGEPIGIGEWQAAWGPLNRYGYTEAGWVLRLRNDTEPVWENIEVPIGHRLLRRADGEFFVLAPDGRTLRSAGEAAVHTDLLESIYPTAGQAAYGTKVRFSGCGRFFGVENHTCEIDLRSMTLRKRPQGTAGKDAVEFLLGGEAERIKPGSCLGVAVRKCSISLKFHNAVWVLLAKHGRPRWTELPQDMSSKDWVSMQSGNFSKPFQFCLRCTAFTCGSRVWYDQRGFLHLRSHDPQVPSVTVSLQTPCAAWLSSGELVGDPEQVDRVRGDWTDVRNAIQGFLRRVRP